MKARRAAMFSAIVFIAIAVGVPLADRWLACRRADSEACVWAKAYLPLSFALWGVAAVIAAVVVFALLRRFSRSPR